MNLKTTYLGLPLRTPLVPAASPLSENLDNLKRLEDAGASAIVLHSIFEEQIRHKTRTPLPPIGLDNHAATVTESYFPHADKFPCTPERYLTNLAKAKEALDIPIIASLNGTTFGGWTAYARNLAQAGADALELNLYSIPTDSDLPADDIETSYLTILATAKAQLKIPVTVKLSPFFTNFAHFARQLDREGADGLVLFNRFYQPDINLETLLVNPQVTLSTSGDLRLPLRWIAILHGRIRASMAATGGIHCGADAFKLLLVGADVTMLCSALIRHGIEHLTKIERELCQCMQSHGFSSVAEFKGILSQSNCPNPSAYERAQYIRAIAIDGAPTEPPVSAPAASQPIRG